MHHPIPCHLVLKWDLHLLKHMKDSQYILQRRQNVYTDLYLALLKGEGDLTALL